MLTPRYYQTESVTAALDSLEARRNPVIMLPTGSGKSLCIALLCAQLPGRILVVTHRKELLVQNASQLGDNDYGFYSAGLGKRDTHQRVIFGGIQSVYSRAQALGDIQTIIVDEAHRVPNRSTESMYRTLFHAYPQAQRIGLTATPYRLSEGAIYGQAAHWFNELAYEVGIADLVKAGFLSPLKGYLTAHNVDVSHVTTRAGEYALGELSQAACEEDLVRGTVRELCAYGQQRQSWLVFCVDISHVEMMTKALNEVGIDAAMLTGKTPSDERALLLARMRSGALRCLVNCEVATTGFDIPRIDLVALCRPTQSKGLLVQMVGRGTRLFDAKEDCVVLDFAGNLDRHIPLDGIEAAECTTERQKADAVEAKKAEEAKAKRKLPQGILSAREPLEGQSSAREYTIHEVFGFIRPAKNKPGVNNLVVSYVATTGEKVTQWLCVEYQGWARMQAEQWFTRRGAVAPRTAKEAMALVRRLPRPERIVVKKDKGWDRILMEHFAEEQLVDDDALPDFSQAAPIAMGQISLFGSMADQKQTTLW